MTNIISCPSCAAVVVREEAGAICPQCRAPLPQSDVVTVMAEDMTRLADPELANPDATPRSGSSGRSAPDSRGGVTSSSGWLASSGAIDHGRFAPGTLLGGRYRIIERRGRGGMGEVYRADDLKLGQPVALKFLPADVDRDPAKLTQLHTEVRMARQVSHPNVCRVYDIDEIEGSTFLSMEYVDGEDLASLLRRVGRFPEDRALEIARQICAGLAAAHERHVVHRDLKPANVMLDATGKVRLTDFGLAGTAGESLRAGTPAYMAPEQLAGGEVTPRSDIYALGLVLYEIFTGLRALDGKNLAEVIHKREQSGITPPTTIVKSLDPKIEAVIQRCLKPEPGERPVSALAVAAALPGGDPLAAALAAGETPSPEMVAAAGQTEAMHPAIGLSLVAVVLAALLACAAAGDRYLLYARVPMQKSLDSLQDRARDLMTALGYPIAGTDSFRGLSVNFDILGHISRTNSTRDRWDALNRRTSPVLLFWHRSSPDPLVPASSNWTPTFYDPPMNVVGMTKMELDDTGRLITFEAVPPRVDGAADSPRPSPWPALFAAAGLDIQAFRPVAPQLAPQAFATERAAWEGPQAGVEGGVLHVEAAALRGLPVGFRVTGPGEPIVPRTTPAFGQRRGWRVIVNATATLLILSTLLLARRNLRAGRGDRRGAWRLFCLAMSALVVAWIVSGTHYASPQVENDRLLEFLAHALTNAGTTWALYIALEPFVRRYTPSVLISWTRAFAGQLLDPRVGRDVLIGVGIGVGVALINVGFNLLPYLGSNAPGQPRATSLQMLLGGSSALGYILRLIPNNMQNGLFFAVAFGVGRAVTGRTWGGTLAAAGLMTFFIFGDSGSDAVWVRLVFITGFVALMMSSLFFGGLLSLVIAFFTNQILNNAPMTLQPSMPYAPSAFAVMLIVFGLAVFGFYASRGGQPLLGQVLQPD
jgi:serine/threonine-protein kinase